MKVAWVLTGLIAAAWLARVIAARSAFPFGDFEVVIATFLAGIAVIAIWSVVLVASAVESARRLRSDLDTVERDSDWSGLRR
jgi:O-antigen ligase